MKVIADYLLLKKGWINVRLRELAIVDAYPPIGSLPAWLLPVVNNLGVVGKFNSYRYLPLVGTNK